MKIVFLDPSGALGGAETALLDLLAAVRRARPSWALTLITAADGPLVERASRLGIDAGALAFPPSLSRLGEWGRRRGWHARARLALGLSLSAWPALRYAGRLRRRLDAIGPHIVHSNGLKMHLLAARARPRASALVWHLHDYPDARPITARLLRANLGRCTALIANSNSVADRARRLFGPGAPVRTLYNSIDLDRFQPDGPALDLDAIAGLPVPREAGGARPVRVGLVATFARWKGHAVFLRALASIKDAAPVRGYVIGAPIYETAESQFSMHELQASAAALGLHDTVGFTGRIDDVPAALRALDIVVHASEEPEPFGLVIAEAMACGRPVIVSRSGGAEEIAQAGALFHEPGNARELAERILELAGDCPRRLSLASAGRRAAVRLFGREPLLQGLLPLYERIAPPAGAA